MLFRSKVLCCVVFHKSEFNRVSTQEMFLMWCIHNRKQVCWTYWIFNQLLTCANRKDVPLTYGHVITIIAKLILMHLTVLLHVLTSLNKHLLEVKLSMLLSNLFLHIQGLVGRVFPIHILQVIKTMMSMLKSHMLEMMFMWKSIIWEMMRTKRNCLKMMHLFLFILCMEVQMALLVISCLFGSKSWQTKELYSNKIGRAHV